MQGTFHQEADLGQEGEVEGHKGTFCVTPEAFLPSFTRKVPIHTLVSALKMKLGCSPQF